MHLSNRVFWETCSKKYPAFFNDPAKVIEFGSYNINGSIRDVFSCSEYTGLDWRPGPAVDIVLLAHEFKSEKVETVVSASMLEHDPFWKLSLKNMINHMKDDGILILSWGAGKNLPHCLEEAPDGEFHKLKAEPVCLFLEKRGLYIHEFIYESSIQLPPGTPPHKEGTKGEVCLIAFKNKALANGPQAINPFIREDRI